MCRLTGMEFANASLYDGGTAVFEAATMAVRITRRHRVVLHPSLNPVYRKMLLTHAANLELDIVEGDDPTDAACVIVQNPSFLGTVADYTALGARCREAKALLVVSFIPVSPLGLVRPPAQWGRYAIGELFRACCWRAHCASWPRKDRVRKITARHERPIVKASCSRSRPASSTSAHQGHVQHLLQPVPSALRVIHLSLWGKDGFKELAVACHSKAEYLKKQLGFATVLNDGPTFNEFAVRLPAGARRVCAAMLEHGFVAGLPLADVGAGEPNDLLIAVTEKRSREELDAFARALENVSCS